MLLKEHFLSTTDDEWEDLFLVWERILHKSSLVLPQISHNKIQLIGLQNKNVFNHKKFNDNERRFRECFTLFFLFVCFCWFVCFFTVLRLMSR